MSAAVPPPVGPGATPTSARALAPDLARGGMLLLIALANVHHYVYGHGLGVRGYPRDTAGADHVVVLLQMLLVDGRAYPLFGLLFGYGIVQLARRRIAVGLPGSSVTRIVRRRGAWMIVIGLVHGLLLWPGDIVGAYGVLAVIMAGLLVAGSDRALLTTSATGALLASLLYSVASTRPPMPAILLSIVVPNPVEAMAFRAGEWVSAGLLANGIGVFGAMTLGAWAARRRVLDEPERFRPQLVRAAWIGVGAAAVLGLPLALMAAQLWASPPIALVSLAGVVHTLGGYAGGIGYAALFGLIAIRLARRGGRPGPVTHAVQACGQRSLSCYLAQSVAFVLLLPAWTLGLGDDVHLWQAALIGFGAWLLILVVAAASDRAGYRGPAELLLRRLTYGRAAPPSRPDAAFCGTRSA